MSFWDQMAKIGGILFSVAILVSLLLVLLMIVNDSLRKRRDKDEFFETVERLRRDFDGSSTEV
jgi:hypothetical protein